MDEKTDGSDKPEIKGGLVLKLGDDNYIMVGDMKIYLKSIDVSGTNGGKKVIELRFIGPRSTVIQRLKR